MGAASRSNSKRCKADCQCGRHRRNAGSFVSGSEQVDRGAATRFKRKISPPSIGDRFGELTIIGYQIGPAGGIQYAIAQCSCGATPHRVATYNLRKGASTRCNACAKKAAGYWTKKFYAYAIVCPDDAHRRRLLNRLSACKNRCHNPNDRGYSNYGGRGIHLYEPWRTDKSAFLAYVMSLDGWDQPRLELDRIDVNKGYEPGNLRFISKRDNCNNKRSIQQMQRYIIELEARLRHCTCGAAKSVHGAECAGPADNS